MWQGYVSSRKVHGARTFLYVKKFIHSSCCSRGTSSWSERLCQDQVSSSKRQGQQQKFMDNLLLGLSP